MKPLFTFITLIFLLTACHSSKKSSSLAKTESAHRVSHADVLKGGTSYDNAIVIAVTSESDGVAEEYKWLNISYPGYATIRKTQGTRGSRHYDIITFRTRDGYEKVAYFDITRFYKK